MQDQQKSLRKSPAPTNIPTSNPLASRPFAPQPKPETIVPSAEFGGYESRLMEFAILNPDPDQAQPLQPKLMIGAPGDRYEQEADRVAAQVVQRLSVTNLGRSQFDPTLQRETLPDEDEKLQMKPILQREALPDEDEELQMKPLTQRQADGPASAATTELEQTIQTLRGRGQPLADSIRQPMEQAFGGADFSQVTIHTDTRSDQLNRSIQARAFTTKNDIFFRQGEYNPDNRGGKELLAHELTHVVQQQPTIQRQGKKEKKTSLEKAAEKSFQSIDASQTERETKLNKLFIQKGSSFNKVADLLHGLLLDSGEKKKYKDQIATAFGTDSWKTKYLQSIVDHGEPSRTMQIALALGLVTGSGKDETEALRIIEETEWDEDDLKEYKKLKFNKEIQDKLSERKQLQVEKFFAKQNATDDAKPTAEVDYLVSMIQRCKNSLFSKESTRANKLIDFVIFWRQTASLKARELAKDGKNVEDALKEVKLEDYNIDYVKSLIAPVSITIKIGGLSLDEQDTMKSKDAWKTEQEFLSEAEKTTSKAKQNKIEESKIEAGGIRAISDLMALLNREETKRKGHLFKTKINHKHEKLKAHIFGLSASEKKLFLETLDGQSLQEKLGNFKSQLEAGGLKTSDIADISKQFELAEAEKDQQLGSNYRDLVKLVARLRTGRVSQSKFPKEAFSILARCNQDELFQARQDAVVWEALKEINDENYKDSIGQVFGLSATKTPQTGTSQPGLTWDSTLKKEDKNWGEYTPQHWSKLINYDIDKHNQLTVKSGHLAELMQHAQRAGKELVTTQQPSQPQTQPQTQNKTPSYNDLKAFTSEVWKDITLDNQAFLDGGYINDYLKDITRKFKNGEDITAEDRVNLAMRGWKTHEQEMTQIIEDSSGEELISLSNFADFKKLLGERKNEQKKEEKSKAIDTFKVDLRPDILRKLEKELGDYFGDSRNQSLVGVVSKARQKLADALPTTIEGLTEAETNSLKERIKILAFGDEEYISNRGVQWTALSSKSDQRKGAFRNLKGAHRVSTEDQRSDEKNGSFRYMGDQSNKEREARINEHTKKIQSTGQVWKDRKAAFDAMKAKYDTYAKLLFKILIGAGISIGGGFIAVGTDWLIGALIKFGMSLINKGLNAGVGFILNREGVTRAELGQLVVTTIMEAGMAFGSEAFGNYIEENPFLSDAEVNINIKISQDVLQAGIEKVVAETPAQLFNDLAFNESVLSDLRTSPGETLKKYFAGEILAENILHLATGYVAEGITSESVSDGWEKTTTDNLKDEAHGSLKDAISARIERFYEAPTFEGFGEPKLASTSLSDWEIKVAILKKAQDTAIKHADQISNPTKTLLDAKAAVNQIKWNEISTAIKDARAKQAKAEKSQASLAKNTQKELEALNKKKTDAEETVNEKIKAAQDNLTALKNASAIYLAVFKDAKKFREKQDELKRILQDKKVVDSLTPESSSFLKQLNQAGDTITKKIKEIKTENIFDQKIIDTLLKSNESLTNEISSFIDEQGRIVNQLKQLKLIP